ncbi:MAG: hypothetical protein GY700_01615 [Propionibacteriaceae bacterium]|nr:hypothetical protein [Propionibacteriaceae bacterium]
MKDCEKHEDLVDRMARMEANIALILQSQQRIEERVYRGHGEASKTSGSVSSMLKIAGIAAAIGAAIAATINLVAG